MNLLAFQAALTPELEQRIRLWMCTRLSITEQCDLAMHFPQRMKDAYTKRLTEPDVLRHLATLTPKRNDPAEMMPDLLRLYFLYNKRYARNEVGSSISLLTNSYLARLPEFLNPLEIALVMHSDKHPRNKKPGELSDKPMRKDGLQPKAAIIFNGHALSI